MGARILVTVVAVGGAALIVLVPGVAELRDLLRLQVAHISLWGHGAVFAGLAFVLWSVWGRMLPWAVGGGLVGLAIGLEGAQGLLPNRAVEGVDLAANLGGLLVGTGIAWLGAHLRAYVVT